jgi:hypothetical protein
MTLAKAPTTVTGTRKAAGIWRLVMATRDWCTRRTQRVMVHNSNDDRLQHITCGPVPEPPYLPVGQDGELPLEGTVFMAYPPNGPTMVKAVWDRCDIIGYRRVRVQQCEPTEPEDRWAYTDEEIPGEYEYELGIGDDFRTRNMVDFIVKLKYMSPRQYASLTLAWAHAVMDQTDPALLN